MKPCNVLLTAVLLVLPFVAQAWPRFDRPENVKVDWVANDVVRNGVPMYIENISCDCAHEKVLDFYRKLWAEIDEKGFVETDLGEYQQISRGDEDYFFSVQIKSDPYDSEKSLGRLVISEMPNKDNQNPVLGEGLPMPADSRVMTDIFDSMPGKKSRTVMLLNTKSIVENMRFYRSHYEALGWKSFLFPVNPDVGSQALSYQQGNMDVNITIHDDSGVSVVVVNEVKTSF
jgi:hypothetical protein